MSFHGNGQRRYGHVPPAQYGTPGAPDQSHPQPGLHRQSSFDNGDDAAFFDPNQSRYQPAGAPQFPSRSANMPQEELFITSPTAPSPSRNTFGTTSPALSGYQHQYQPFPAGAQSPGVAQAYNPQHFARTQSQSQASHYQPPAAYASTNYSQGPQPYNPANYQTSQPAAQVSRQSTVSGYQSSAQVSRQSTVSGYGTHNSYASTPQTPSYRPAGPPVPARPFAQSTYEQPVSSPTYSASSSAPLPPRQSLYTPPHAPYPTNGDNYSQDIYQTPVATHAPVHNYGAYSQQASSGSRPVYNDDPNSFVNVEDRLFRLEKELGSSL